MAAVGETEVIAYVFENAFTGTTPRRNTIFALQDIETTADTEAGQYAYNADMTGRAKTGTEPYQNTESGVSDKGMTTTADTESYQYEVKRCGSNRL